MSETRKLVLAVVGAASLACSCGRIEFEALDLAGARGVVPGGGPPQTADAGPISVADTGGHALSDGGGGSSGAEQTPTAADTDPSATTGPSSSAGPDNGATGPAVADGGASVGGGGPAESDVGSAAGGSGGGASTLDGAGGAGDGSGGLSGVGGNAPAGGGGGAGRAGGGSGIGGGGSGGASNVDVELLYRARVQASNRQPSPEIEVHNLGEDIALGALSIRYYFDSEEDPSRTDEWSVAVTIAGFYAPYADFLAEVEASVVEIAPAVVGADSYVELRFPASTRTLTMGDHIVLSFYLSIPGGVTPDQTNDYSFDSGLSMDVWDRITVWYSGESVWGIAP